MEEIRIDQAHNAYELSVKATKFLKEHGLDMRGLPKTKDSYPQTRFEQSMLLGAYSGNKQEERDNLSKLIKIRLSYYNLNSIVVEFISVGVFYPE